jgi:hypothetical protein
MMCICRRTHECDHPEIEFKNGPSAVLGKECQDECANLHGLPSLITSCIVSERNDLGYDSLYHNM